MAAHGFISAEVDYPNSLDELFCTLLFKGFRGFLELVSEKAGKVFPHALNAVCSHPRADCNQGLAVSGHSQGGFLSLAVLKHASPRVTAVLPLGVGCLAPSDEELIPEMTEAKLSEYLPKEKRLLLTGNKDDLYSHKCLQTMSGYPSARTDVGPGYMQVPSGSHQFFSEYELLHSKTRMKCQYRDSNEPWGFDSALHWLGSTASPSKFIPLLGGSSVAYSSGCVHQPLDKLEKGDVFIPVCLVLLILGSLCGCCCCCFCCVVAYSAHKKRQATVDTEPQAA